MKKYIFLSLLLFNLIPNINKGTLNFGIQEIKAQNYGDENSSADGLTNEEWVALSSPDPDAIENYLSGLEPGDHISVEFYEYLQKEYPDYLDNFSATDVTVTGGGQTNNYSNIFLETPIVDTTSNCTSCECLGNCPEDDDEEEPPSSADTKDCAGVVGGNAYLDNCQECVGGTTEKTACDCEGDKCPICKGLVIIEDENTAGLMKVQAASPTCKKCTCLKKYTISDECKAWGQMYNDAIAQKNEYCSIVTQNNIYTWKTEETGEGVWSGPFNPKWDSNQSHWYILDKNGNKQYIIGVVHVHWDSFDVNFSGPEGDLGVAQTLHGAPLLLFNASGDVKYMWSPDGVRYGQDKLPYKVSSLINCNKSLMNFFEGK